MPDRSSRVVEAPSRDSGFGIIEVVIAMFLLGLIAVAFLPLLQTSMKLASKNVTAATASQLVNEQMDTARGLAPTCAAIREFSTETIGLLIADPRGTVLEIHRHGPTTCPTSYPTSVIFRTTVTIQGSSDVLSEATTRIYLKSELGVVSP